MGTNKPSGSSAAFIWVAKQEVDETEVRQLKDAVFQKQMTDFPHAKISNYWKQLNVDVAFDQLQT